MPGYINPNGGRGFARGYYGYGRGRGGFGRGGGRGRRNWYYATGLTGWQRAASGFPAWGAAAYPNYGGYTNPYGPELTPKQESDMLKEEAKAMQDEISSINERIKELESMQKKAKDQK
jgi:hypothetical protein